MKDNQELIEENNKLKEEVEIYQKGYENVLTEKLLLEQEYENYKIAMEESMKAKNQGIYGSTTIFNIQTDNVKYKSEIDEYLNRIWELETNLSLKDEEMRILSEKNKKLEEDNRLLKERNNNDEKEEKDEKDEEENQIKSSRIFNLEDLYKSTVIQNTERKIKNKIKQTINLNVITEDEMEKKKEEEEREKRRREEEEFDRKKKKKKKNRKNYWKKKELKKN